ncbi:MAG: sugar ABC transporter ATP-binding protein [Actinobacteria bacterium]|nr:sugar ABC transporter ATP-binding protein [Actinomycetota bacterium]
MQKVVNKLPVPVIEMRGISKRYGGVQALKGVDLIINKGEIHGLIGQNGAGKSTLIRVLSGATACDEGTIKIFDRNIDKDKLTPSLIHNLGVSFMYQEPLLVPSLSIADNIFLGREDTRGYIGWINNRFQLLESAKLLEPLGLNWDTSSRVEEMGLGKRRIIEVVRAIGYDAKIFVMDEPTAALTSDEKDWLFTILKKLRDQGKSVILVSHYLDEVLEISDRITVLRDGKLIDTLEVNNDLNLDFLCSLVVGYRYSKGDIKIKPFNKGSEAIFEVVKLTKSKRFEDISFIIHPGEAIGIGGLTGSGQMELAMALFGATGIDSGEIKLMGKKLNVKNTVDAIKASIGMVPEDRKEQGLLLNMSIRHNMTLAILNKISPLGFVDQSKERNLAKTYADRLNIVMSSQDMATTSLSGGNAQKVVIAKWLIAKSNILIINEPTRGVDIASREEIHRLLVEIASQGVAIILISSELDELCNLCHQVFVIKNGRFKYNFKQGEITEDQLLSRIMEGD